jgi:hypothetical protein
LAIFIAVLEFFVKANNEAKRTKVKEIIFVELLNLISLFQNNFVDVMRRNMRLR